MEGGFLTTGPPGKSQRGFFLSKENGTYTEFCLLSKFYLNDKERSKKSINSQEQEEARKDTILGKRSLAHFGSQHVDGEGVSGFADWRKLKAGHLLLVQNPRKALELKEGFWGGTGNKRTG